jgi:N-acetylneuraminate synthase/N,N'-diacetyllegionaminate synthase
VVEAVAIGSHLVGPGRPCLLIAEVGVNHNGDVELARRLVAAAAEAGADAVKFQTFDADRLVTAEAPKAAYQASTTGADESQLELLRRLELPNEHLAGLRELATAHGILFISTPFDEGSADRLDELGVAAFKIASPDVTNIPFLTYVARKGRPVVLSTGMSTLEETAAAVAAIRAEGAPLVVLHCVSAYPAEPADANLAAIGTLERELGAPAGFSDHSLGDAVPLAAVALGARALEKHLTLDRSLPGPDHRASLEPDALASLFARVREVESAIGDGVKRPVPAEEEGRVLLRRSLAARRGIPAGTVITAEMLTAMRPATGIPPTELERVVGRRAARDVAPGALLEPADVA